ncbi:MAG: penicillin-binding protein activator LpoB [Treponema sp.]|nr:penicillin-binding protein activator LpoB [Treponema sp.]
MVRHFFRFVAALALAAGWIIGGNSALYGQAAVPLGDAIKTGVAEIELKLAQGVKVVVLNFRSPSQRLSDYILDELMTELVRNGRLVVVDRANLELLQQEMNFQMSGEVSDSSAQAIGQKLGAQSIISGNIEDIGADYRIRFRTIEVESAAIQVLTSITVRKDRLIANLMARSSRQAAARTESQNAAPDPGELNFPTERKVGAGFLNLLYGAGSFSMGDWAGGLIVGGIELTGSIIFLAGVVGTEDEYGDFYYTDSDVAAIVIGLGISLAGNIVGFIRPFSYDRALAAKNGAYHALGGNPLNNITVAPVVQNGAAKVTLLYSASF